MSGYELRPQSYDSTKFLVNCNYRDIYSIRFWMKRMADITCFYSDEGYFADAVFRYSDGDSCLWQNGNGINYKNREDCELACIETVLSRKYDSLDIIYNSFYEDGYAGVVKSVETANKTGKKITAPLKITTISSDLRYSVGNSDCGIEIRVEYDKFLMGKKRVYKVFNNGVDTGLIFRKKDFCNPPCQSQILYMYSKNYKNNIIDTGKDYTRVMSKKEFLEYLKSNDVSVDPNLLRGV